MRLTVGPLPPAVYWRRRAIVLGTAVVVIFLIVQSCSGGDASSSGNAQNGHSSAPAAAPKTTVLRPQIDPTTDEAAPTQDPPPSNPAPRTGDAAPPPDDGSCTDAEMLVTPVPEVTSADRGTLIAIRLRIKNSGKRTCNRDVGADQQELYIKKGAAKVWSSDTCGNVKGTDVQPFTPGFEREYRVDWNGHDVSKCAGILADGPIPPAGDYQVFGRLATKTSNPVKLTLK